MGQNKASQDLEQFLKHFGKTIREKDFKINRENVLGGAEGLYLLGQIFQR